MTFGASSAVFRQYLADAVGPTASFAPHLATGGAWRAALFGNTGTPDKTVTAALSAYAAATSQWVTANELTSSTQWPAGGIALAYGTTSTRFVATGNTVTFDADDTAGAGNVTLANVFGDLVYDSSAAPVTNQGLAFHSYGGAQGVTAGTFTVVWNAAGVAQVTV